MYTQTLTADQMKHLRELGIDTNDATLVHVDIDQSDLSMAYMGNNTFMKKTDYSKTLVDNGLAYYVYTLQDVLEHLPKKIYAEEVYSLSITPVSSRLWNITYTCIKDEGEETLRSFASSLMDAAYKMLCYTKMNHY
ncbi:MAG: hypothetical protein MJZ83_03915 [Bacteroidaceae bacterium]|nr:hypothetical protein [Bacteroidaceae bacterium]